MAYTLHVELHPLGLVVRNEEDGRELLIEGEKCCGISYDDLKKIATTSRSVEVDDLQAFVCRLNQS